MVPDAGYDVTLLAVQGVQRSISPATARAAGRFGAALPGSMALLRRLRPQVVVSVGGYASVPPVLAAWALRIPVVVVSYDAVPGAAAPPAVPPGGGERRRLRHVAAAPQGGHRRPAAPRHPRHRPDQGPGRARGGARAADRPLHAARGGRVARFGQAQRRGRGPGRRARTPAGPRHPPRRRQPSRPGVVRAAGGPRRPLVPGGALRRPPCTSPTPPPTWCWRGPEPPPWPSWRPSANRRSWCRGRWPPRTTRRPTPRCSRAPAGRCCVPDVELTPERLLAEVDRLRAGSGAPRLDGGAGPLGRRPRRRRSHRRPGRALREEAPVSEHVSEPGTPVPVDLTVPGRYHVVGVGGPGMRAIALVLAEMGHARVGERPARVARPRPAAGGRHHRARRSLGRPTSKVSTPSPRPRPSPHGTWSWWPRPGPASRSCGAPACWRRSAPAPARWPSPAPTARPRPPRCWP